jgi:hypothetical protein
VLLLLLLSLAKGWTVWRRKISATGRVKLSVFVTLFGLVQITCLAWALSQYGEETSEVVHLYGSLPGWFLVGARVAAFVWFFRSTMTTRKQYEQGKGWTTFYRKLLVFYSIYLLWLPSVAIIANYGLPVSARAKFVYALEATGRLLAHLYLVFLFWPSR